MTRKRDEAGSESDTNPIAFINTSATKELVTKLKNRADQALLLLRKQQR